MKFRHHILGHIFHFAATLAVVPCSCATREGGNEPSFICYSSKSSTIIHPVTDSRASHFDNQTLMVFTYNDDPSALLDAVQECTASSEVSITTTVGSKVAVAVLGLPPEHFRIEDILSYASVCKCLASLADEDPQRPVMCGECRFEAGTKTVIPLELTPLLCRIYLRRLEVDFSGTPYAGEKLTDMRAYLTNVRALCPIVESSGMTGVEIINCGALDSVSMASLSHPELLEAANPGSGTSLYCYPSDSNVSDGVPDPGNPPTRLVIEGRIKGNLYYYPITLANGNLKRGVCYNYSIRITRSGGSDPDSPLESGVVTLDISSSTWNEMEDEIENY